MESSEWSHRGCMQPGHSPVYQSGRCHCEPAANLARRKFAVHLSTVHQKCGIMRIWVHVDDKKREDDCLVIDNSMANHRMTSYLISLAEIGVHSQHFFEAASLSTRITIVISRTRMLLKNSYPV
jgi:hypothetical protein